VVGRGQFSHAFSGEVYDFYSVSPEYFGYTLVLLSVFGLQVGKSDMLTVALLAWCCRLAHSPTAAHMADDDEADLYLTSVRTLRTAPCLFELLQL
jgi:hypothetical protein